MMRKSGMQVTTRQTPRTAVINELARFCSVIALLTPGSLVTPQTARATTVTITSDQIRN